MAAAGVCSSGAGLETVNFPSPITAKGRLELWVRDLDRQIVSSIVRDVDTTVKVLVAHGQVGPGRPPLLQIGWSKSRTGDSPGTTTFGEKGGRVRGGGTIGEGGSGASVKSENPGISHLHSRGTSDSSKPNTGTTATTQNRGNPDKGGGNGPKIDGEAEDIPRPCVQGHLLARSVHWTRLVEAALIQGISLLASTNGVVDNPCESESRLQGVLSALLLYLDGWVGELRQPGSISLYSSITNTALITQAVQQRDVVEELLKVFSPSFALTSTASSDIRGKTTVATGRADAAGVTDSARAHDGDTAFISSSSVPLSSSFPARGLMSRTALSSAAEEDAVSADGFPFTWTCHLRHYHVPVAEALLTESAGGREESTRKYCEIEGSDNRRYRRNDEDTGNMPPPPPLLTVGLGTWKIPYGFEYAGTLERLWLSPLSERCLLHAAQSATVS